MLPSIESRNIPDDRITVQRLRRHSISACGKSASGNIAVLSVRESVLQER